MTTNWSIDSLTESLTAKKISAREIAADFYKRIEARNAELNAYLALSPERAWIDAITPTLYAIAIMALSSLVLVFIFLSF